MVFLMMFIRPMAILPSYNGVILGPLRMTGSKTHIYMSIALALCSQALFATTLCFCYRYILVANERIKRMLRNWQWIGYYYFLREWILFLKIIAPKSCYSGKHNKIFKWTFFYKAFFLQKTFLQKFYKFPIVFQLAS